MPQTQKLNKFNMQTLTDKIIKYTLPIIVFISIAVMMYLSFINSIESTNEIRSIGLFAITGAFLSYLIWLTAYKDLYDKIMGQDRFNADLIIDNKEQYSIHKRYYFARKGWRLPDLQKKLEIAKEAFRLAWLSDVEEITGRSIEEIKNGKYKGFSHKLLIWRVKHHMYPKYGIKFARQMTNVLSIGHADSMSVNINTAESHFKWNALQKIVVSILTLVLTGSILIEFISANWMTAILKLFISVLSLLISLLFGSLNGNTGAKMKLAVAEEVSYLLEEWRDNEINPAIEPYKLIETTDKLDDIKGKVDSTTVEIT